ncbi:hypothetical protein XM25_17175 [Devosia sp. H5989]|nr:hypothetical protein XM25_17175 [Devosia sp. H5989]
MELVLSLILTDPAEIRTWAEARSGQPALAELPSGSRTKIILQIVFDQYLLNSGEAQEQDRPGGLDLVSWDEWIAELEKQGLGLRVPDDVPGSLDNTYEFVSLADNPMD